jgi:3-oxoacyl-[acyl-carrier-protein] synthase II
MVTPQGTTATATFDNIMAGRVLLDTGRVALAHDSADRVTQLAAVAAHEAIADAGWTAAALRGPRTALLIGTSKGPIERWIAASAGGAALSRPIFGMAELASDLNALLGLRPEFQLTYSAACASGLHAFIKAYCLIRQGACDRVLVVASESSLGALFQATFQRLGVLAPAGYGCRPFDRNRRGFTLSEAAAAVCLDHQPRPAGVIVNRAAMFADAHHLTATDPEAATLRHLLADLRGPNGIDFVHAHGTGTGLNDPAELAAIDALLGDSAPQVYSHKAALGHTQGAAGLLAVAINTIVHRSGRIPPNAATAAPLPTTSARLIAGGGKHRLTTSLAIAAGFGGPVAGVKLMATGESA